MNIQISITENGTTTLATAGKYCDRNVDVSVNVPSKDVELAEQKAITDSILTREITEFASDTLEKIGANAFYYCEALQTLYCPNASRVARYGCGYCTTLKRAEFHHSLSIYDYAFYGCSALDTLIIKHPGVCGLYHTRAFTDTPIANGTGYIYVPDNLVDSYKTATNWSSFADQIKPISELGE